MARKVFPSNPNTNDVFTSTRGKKFQWNGKVWKRTQDTNVESMTLDSSADEKLALHGSDNPTIRFREGSNDKGNLHWKASTGEMRLVNEESSQELRLGSSGVTVTGNLDVTGNLEVTGTTTFNGGTLTLGDSATDNVVFGADVNSSITPNTDDAYDLGSSNKQWRNLYIDGTANIDTLSADSATLTTADINGGTVDGTAIGGNSPSSGAFTTLSASGNVDLGNATVDTITATGRFDSNLLASADDTYDLGANSRQWKDLYIDGIANIDTLRADSSTLTTVDIDGGSIDGTTIGGSTPAAGTFTTLVASGNVDLGDATSDTITATGRFDSNLVPSADGTYDLGSSSLEWNDLYIDGTAHIDSLRADSATLTTATLTTADINGGTIDGTAIGGNSPSSGAFTSLSASGNVDLGNSSSDTITATGRFDSNLLPDADSSRVLGSSALRWSNFFVDLITVTNDVSIGGDLTVIGDANITGTLTYEDVTNIDSVGIVTARSGLVVSSGGANITGGITGDLTGDVTGNADTATTLATSRTLSISGAGTGSASFNGGANADIALTLANSGVTAGTYGSSSAIPSITVDAKGLITSASTTAIDSTSISNGNSSVSVSGNGQITSNANHDFDSGIDVTGNITVTGTVDGRDVATDGSKLDGIESGATADQTAAEIRTLVESASDSNVFTDADHSKLNGIASGAQVNVGTNLGTSRSSTGVTITSSTGNNTSISEATSSDAGVMTSAMHDKLDGIASGAQVNVATNLSVSTTTTTNTIASSTGTNATIGEATGSAAGLMSTTHHNKLDGIASGATNVTNNNQISNGRGFITSSSNISGTAGGLSGTPNITVGTISCGNITSSGTITANSDAKLKKNVATVSNALDKVNLLRGVEFDYIADDKHSIGVIAQEVEAVLPDLVEGDETKSVAYGNLTAVLIEAVKELTAEVNTLKAELNTLKGE